METTNKVPTNLAELLAMLRDPAVLATATSPSQRQLAVEMVERGAAIEVEAARAANADGISTLRRTMGTRVLRDLQRLAELEAWDLTPPPRADGESYGVTVVTVTVTRLIDPDTGEGALTCTVGAMSRTSSAARPARKPSGSGSGSGSGVRSASAGLGNHLPAFDAEHLRLRGAGLPLSAGIQAWATATLPTEKAAWLVSQLGNQLHQSKLRLGL